MAETRKRRPHPKEHEIHQLLLEGLSNNEIRRRTGADLRTIAARRELANVGPAPRPRPKARPHPREAEILAALQAGGSNSGISEQLHVDKVAVARIRRDNGIPDVADRQRAERPGLQELWRQYARETEGGHMAWDGPRASGSRTPLLRHVGSWYSAAAVAFEMRTGRTPKGQVKTECTVKHCVAPACVEDEAGRQALRLMTRRLQGLPDPPTGHCKNGHDLAVDGRLDARLHPYCEGCKRDRKTTARQTTT
ncbi:hypothetical protein [Streptomyces tendae]|uniref:hypothetical protein n=1 Tax=Streptomyces tendae TaxID=1932 RepID=UPI003446F5B7